MITPTPAAVAADRYLNLLIGCLTRELFLDQEWWDADLRDWPDEPAATATELRTRGWRMVRRGDAAARAEGRDWPPTAETMIGRARLDNVRWACETALSDGVAGDFVETGVWRGGATILMRAVLAAHNIADRRVWCADSFEGLPVPDPDTYPADAGQDIWSTIDTLKVDVDAVRSNFDRYGLLDDQVKFLVGWFRDTLPTAPITEIAVLRLDGDLYESTMDALVHLEPKVSQGGIVIVDDYGGWPPCRAAVDDYRSSRHIGAAIETVDWTGAWWRVER